MELQVFLYSDLVLCNVAINFWSVVMFMFRSFPSSVAELFYLYVVKATGLKICVQVMKNKLAPGMNSAELGIDFGKGLHFEREVLELALEHGLVLKEGNSYYIEGEIFNSEQSAKR